MEHKGENKKNRKRRYSIMLITQAYIELLKEKSPEEIHVTDICRVADVNRSTFYSNFVDINDLAEYIWREIMQKFKSVISQYEDLTEQQFYDELFQIFDNSEYKKILCYTVPEKWGKELHDTIFETIVMPRMSDIKDMEAFRIVHDYASIGGAEIIKNWVLGKYDISADDMSKLICELTVLVVKHIDPDAFAGRI